MNMNAFKKKKNTHIKSRLQVVEMCLNCAWS